MGGLFFEELVPGTVLSHDIGRTVTETDNLLFTALTMNVQPLHLDEEAARIGSAGSLVVNGIFVLGLVVGIPVGDLTVGTLIASFGFEQVEFPEVVRIGDTIRVETEVLSARPSRSRPEGGIVTLEHRGRNQLGAVVCSCRRAVLMKRKTTA